ncbi:MAG: hypothetical protein ACI9YH_000086 [Colwellia sp.]|jgi:hypothetical protein
MTNFKKALFILSVSLPVLAISLPSQAAMTPHIKNALIDICKAAKSDSTIKLNYTTKSYRLKTKTVALKVMCNGEDLISFAESNGAYKTAEKLQNSIGNVTITDIAALSKVNVNF